MRSLLKEICRENNLTEVQAAKTVRMVFQGLREALKEGNSVSIRNFGHFELLFHASRDKVDNFTGDMMVTKPKVKIKFSPSSKLTNDINTEQEMSLKHLNLIKEQEKHEKY